MLRFTFCTIFVPSVFKLLTFFKLTTTYDMEPTKTYYFEGDGDTKMAVTNFNQVKGKTITKLIIAYNFTLYIDKVKVKQEEGPSSEPPQVYILQNVIELFGICMRVETDLTTNVIYEFKCEEYARVIEVSAPNAIEDIMIYHSEVYLEHYAGCFDYTDKNVEGVRIRSVEGCMAKCERTSYLAIKMDGTCICIEKLSMMAPVTTNLCDKSCPENQRQLCGSETYFSVYSKEPITYLMNAHVTWDCIFSQTSCITCPEGRVGFNCEFLDCLVENGHCLNLQCEQFLASKLISGVCICSAGYYITEAKQCQDLDECKVSSRCEGENTVCINTVGSYDCECILGFKLDLLDVCKDIDECLLELVCDESSTICINSQGDYECACREGYTRARKTLSKSACEDIDECSVAFYCPQQEHCINLPGSYDCSCPRGTIKMNYGFRIECEDVDECIDTGICNTTTSFCINTKSSYVCGCRIGYLQVDNYSCTLSEKGGMESKSTNAEEIYEKNFNKVVIDLNTTSYVKSLSIVYTKASKVTKIVQIVGFERGRFSSKQCLPKTSVNTYIYMCEGVSRIITLEGGGIIKKIIINSFGLKLENYVGCFRSSEVGINSVDPDDCLSKCEAFHYYGIKPNGKCLCIDNLSSLGLVEFSSCSEPCMDNTVFLCGSPNFFSVYSRKIYTKQRLLVPTIWKCIYDQTGCPSCMPGNVGINCEQNDCSLNNGNCVGTICETLNFVTTGLKYAVCLCPVGFRLDKDQNCQDARDCSTFECENGVCEKIFGEIICKCNPGFYPANQTICNDLDECESAEKCPGNSSVCVNKIGDYECSCNEGYVRDDEMNNKSECADVDECEQLGTICPDDSPCVNLPGTYECICPEGTKRAKYFKIFDCEDINECLNTDICNGNTSFCVNTRSSYICGCRPGYRQLDNFSCAVSKKNVETTESDETDEFTSPAYGSENTIDLAIMYFVFLGILVVFAIVLPLISFGLHLTRKGKSPPAISETSSKISDETL